MSWLKRSTWVAAAAGLLAMAGCGTSEELRVTGSRYTFMAPGRFQQEPMSRRAFEEVEDPATAVALEDQNNSGIYVSVRDLSKERLPARPTRIDQQRARAILWRKLAEQHMLAGQYLGKAVSTSVAGMSGVVAHGIPAVGSTADTHESLNYALRDSGGDTAYVISCQWTRDPAGAKQACNRVLSTLQPR
jgi:hypothetical protein